MTSLSPAAILAWRIAGYEALQSHAEFIGKEHLFIGILSLDKVLPDDPEEKVRNAEVAQEDYAISQLMEITGLNKIVVRRLLRQALGSTSTPQAGRVLHRSADCKRYFRRAEVLAGVRDVTCLDLFSAIMEDCGETIMAVLAEARTCVPARRETDIFLPASADMPVTGHAVRGSFDLRGRLKKQIEKTCQVMKLLSPGSQEYMFVRAGLMKMIISLALVCIDEDDNEGLSSALQYIPPFPQGDGSPLATTVAGIRKVLTEEDGTGGQSGQRIRDLLLALDRLLEPE